MIHSDMITTEINKKIIIELQKNGRISYAKLAKIVGVNVSTAKKRLDQLLSTNTIMVRAAFNPITSGYAAKALIALNVELTKISSVSAALVDNFNVNLVVTTFGPFEILMLASYQSWDTLHDFIKSELSIIEGVHKVSSFFISKIIKSVLSREHDQGDNTKNMELDQIDFDLISELAKDGRSKCTYLSEKLGIRTSMVSRRISSLIKNNVISIRAMPNPSILGYLADAYIFFHVEARAVDEICAKLHSHEEVYFIATLVNEYNILIGVNFPTPDLLNSFILNEIAPLDGLLNIETYIRAEIKKLNYSYFLFKEE